MLKGLGIFLIVHPILLAILFVSFDWRFGWYISAHYQWFDLAFAVLSFAVVCVGISLLGMRRPRALMVLLAVFFVLYQIGSLPFKSDDRFAERTALAERQELLLVQASGGALADGRVHLVISEPKFAVLRKHTTIKTYDWAPIVHLQQEGDRFTVVLEQGDKTVTRDRLSSQDINNLSQTARK